jgi:two-component system, chemotaxis family, sensor kinase CheA
MVQDTTMDELIKEFLQESSENLDRLDQDFVQLESDPANLELLKSIFRTIHTIKGTCGFLGFSQLESLTHAGESLLSLLREGEITLSQGIADVLLEMVDAVRKDLQQIEVTGTDAEAEHGGLIARLKNLQGDGAKSKAILSPEESPVVMEAAPSRQASSVSTSSPSPSPNECPSESQAASQPTATTPRYATAAEAANRGGHSAS